MSQPAHKLQATDNGHYSLLSLPMWAVLVAQFFSALADNALFVAAIALLKSGPQQTLVPWLQEAFVIAYIVLAPFVGPFADTLPKGRAMLVANSVKLGGAIFILAGGNILLGYLLVGAGAAMYSPAKYGILTQLFTSDKLVRANGMLEGSTIVAILAGVIIGGWLADQSLQWAFVAVVVFYLIAALANLLIPRLVPEHPLTHFSPLAMLRDFKTAMGQLLRHPDTRFSIIGTGVFWGTGATLRLILFAWVPVALATNDNQTPSMLMGALSVGIVVGAVLAGMLVKLQTANRALVGGLLIGPVVLLLHSISSLPAAALLMALIGLCGGFFVIPLNALLQERGHEMVGAGHALAIQNFWENLGILAFVGLYMASGNIGLDVNGSVSLFGGVVLFSLLGLAVWRIKGRRLVN